MPNVRANGIQIEYDTFGDAASPALLLIMGLGSQMVRWEETFCNQLAERGHYVIRFDNRDVGLSTQFPEAGVPHVLNAMRAQAQGEAVTAPYTLDDMADDTVGLLDALDIERAHICGASMGGMIAQTVAIRHPARVASLISIMSTTGNPSLPAPKPAASAVLFKPAPKDRAAFIEHTIAVRRVIGSPGFPFDEDVSRHRAARDYDRCFHPEGTARQLMAVVAHGNRKNALKSVTAPTLVIHGDADPLVPVEGGRDTAEAIPGADLLIIEGMGHELPLDAWPRVVEAIATHTQKANSASTP